ncbi:MAG TPA: VOC family protein [Bellilinea sp.]|nr:VOC family protein [Bellilinea sp.]
MAKRFIFTYLFTNDLHKMKEFYSNILHLKLIWDSDDSIAYKIGDHQLDIEYDQDFKPMSRKYSWQPGWKGGTEARTSWSLECDRPDFEEIVASAQAAKAPSFHAEPQWVGYWSFPLLDPMGNTVEVTCGEPEPTK